MNNINILGSREFMKITKQLYRIIFGGLLLITFVITLLWISNSSLLRKWYFYIIWIISIIIGIEAYLNSKKSEISKIMKTLLLIITIFSTILLFGTIVIYLITSSM